MSHSYFHLPNHSTLSTVLLVICGVLALAPITFGQGSTAEHDSEPPAITEGASLKTFDVVSIVPVKDFNSSGYNYSPDGYWAKALSVSSSIEEAYGIYDSYRIIGLPGWATSLRYNIEAKVDADNLAEYQRYTLDQRRVMIQGLLTDRFKLKTHFGTKELPIYLLKVSSRGPRFSESANTPGSSTSGIDCLAKGTSRVGYLPIEHCSMSGFARILTHIVGYQVANQTGLTGKYDVELTWSPDTSMNPVDHDQDEAPGGPSIFTAIQNELGLKLQLSKGPVDILVVDHIDMPSPN
ncbi:MAG: TIGR03435 family protein [Silvibacterium sp.]